MRAWRPGEPQLYLDFPQIGLRVFRSPSSGLLHPGLDSGLALGNAGPCQSRSKRSQLWRLSRGYRRRPVLAAARRGRSLGPPEWADLRDVCCGARAARSTRPLPLGTGSARAGSTFRDRDGTSLVRRSGGAWCRRGRGRWGCTGPAASDSFGTKCVAGATAPSPTSSRRSTALAPSATIWVARGVCSTWCPKVPTPVWGRDDLHAGEMWNSNSLISWLILRSGLDVESIHTPLNGRAPGWSAGIVIARRQQAEQLV